LTISCRAIKKEGILETIINLAKNLLSELGIKIPKYLKISLLIILIGICLVPIYRTLFSSKSSSTINKENNSIINPLVKIIGNNNQATLISQQAINNNYFVSNSVDTSLSAIKTEPQTFIIEGLGAEILKTKKEVLLQYLKKSNINKIIISLTYSNQIHQVGDLYYYPGGLLIIKVNGVQCSCFANSYFFIPRTEPFGNPRYDVEQQIKNNVEKIIHQNLDQIIQTVANCI
jgi:hypothetical protein